MLLARLDALRPVLVCAGDDESDEDLFAAVPRAISIRVGASRQTRARYEVAGVIELARFLEYLRGELADRERIEHQLTPVFRTRS